LRFAEPWINPKGETIIPLLIRGYNNKESSSLSALNLTTKSFYFDYQDTINDFLTKLHKTSNRIQTIKELPKMIE